MRFAAVILGCLLFFSSCKRKKEVVGDLPPMSTEKLVSALLNSIPNIPYYSAKAEVGVKMDEVNRSVNSHVRSVNDSLLWVSVTPALGIEVARILLSQDSVKLMDRINDQYFLGSTKDAQSKFGVPIELQLLQDAFKGIPIGFDANEKYRADRENGQYVLLSKGPKRFMRAAEDLNPLDTLNESEEQQEARRLERILKQAHNKERVITKYWINPATMLTTRVLIADLAAGMQADISYKARHEVNGTLLPKEVEVVVVDNTREARVTLELSKIKLSGPLSTSFRIPDKYEPMEP